MVSARKVIGLVVATALVASVAANGVATAQPGPMGGSAPGGSLANPFVLVGVFLLITALAIESGSSSSSDNPDSP